MSAIPPASSGRRGRAAFGALLERGKRVTLRDVLFLTVPPMALALYVFGAAVLDFYRLQQRQINTTETIRRHRNLGQVEGRHPHRITQR